MLLVPRLMVKIRNEEGVMQILGGVCGKLFSCWGRLASSVAVSQCCGPPPARLHTRLCGPPLLKTGGELSLVA